MKTYSEHLKEVSKGKSGACWMQDFEPQIVEAAKSWLSEKLDTEYANWTAHCVERAVIKALIAELSNLESQSNLKTFEEWVTGMYGDDWATKLSIEDKRRLSRTYHQEKRKLTKKLATSESQKIMEK